MPLHNTGKFRAGLRFVNSWFCRKTNRLIAESNEKFLYLMLILNGSYDQAPGIEQIAFSKMIMATANQNCRITGDLIIQMRY